MDLFNLKEGKEGSAPLSKAEEVRHERGVLWLCKAGMILYVFTMLVLTIGYCSVSIYRKYFDNK